MSNWEAIILDFDGGDRLERCLVSLESQTIPPVRLIVVDNGSRIPVAARIGNRSVETVLLRSETNLGFTGGTNLAWNRAEAPLLALVNNDVELASTWVSRLIDALERSPRTGAAQTLIVTRDGTIDGAGIDISSGRFLQLGFGRPLETRLPEPWGVSATATLFRRRALEEIAIGGDLLHPRFFAYYEDVELSARLRAAGWEMLLLRDPLAIHEGSATAAVLGKRGEYLRTRNRYFVLRLHRHVGSASRLLLEDVKKMLRAVSRGEIRKAFTISKGVAAGFVVSVRWDAEQR